MYFCYPCKDYFTFLTNFVFISSDVLLKRWKNLKDMF